MSGIERIAAERQRQIEAEGYTREHDAEHDDGSLAKAAQSYLVRYDGFNSPRWGPPTCWPWAESDWKPSRDPIRNLEKAGALIAAEIDRLSAAPAQPPEAPEERT